jgi:hypothetical protein
MNKFLVRLPKAAFSPISRLGKATLLDLFRVWN